MDEKMVNEGKELAWLSYLGILLFIPLLVNKDNEYSKFHVKQGIVLLVCMVIYSSGMYILHFIPFVNYMGWIIAYVMWLFFLILTIMGIVNALAGKTEPLPFIGQFAEK
ncbi:MAG TPA: hypothetical protein PKN36_01405 [bacterium]|nr:hypothetical protein [bacterium]